LKIHVSLGKIVNALVANGEAQGGRKSIRTFHGARESSSPVETPAESPLPEQEASPEPEEEEIEAEETTVIQDKRRKAPVPVPAPRTKKAPARKSVEEEDEEMVDAMDIDDVLSDEEEGTVVDDGRTIMTKQSRSSAGRDSLMSELLSDEESDEF
jgi:outer membrane biosynthesis protein TonB